MTDEELLDFDFEAEVEDTKKHIEETEKKIDKNDSKANKIVSKLEKISSNFDIAESTVTELSTEIEDDVKEVKSIANISPSDMFQLDILYSDFTNIRTTLMDTVTKGKTVIDTLTNELAINPTDAELVASYSQLIGVVNSSMKLLSTTYKDISDVILRIKKFEEESGNSGATTNIQNNFHIESTADIIKKLRGE